MTQKRQRFEIHIKIVEIAMAIVERELISQMASKLRARSNIITRNRDKKFIIRNFYEK